MPWATVQQVQDQTGKTVSAEHLALASSIIDTYAGTDPEMPQAAITPRDRSILRKACAWQAVWVGSQPGYLEHRGVDYSPSADGTSAQRKSQADQDLAPLAQRELKNLSWAGTRVVSLRSRTGVPKGALLTDFLNESSDYWQGIGGQVGPDYVPGTGGSGGSSSIAWTEITGRPVVFPPEGHLHDIADVTGLQDALDAAGGGTGGGPVAWEEITGKPATFPPDSHTHAWASITDKPTAYPPVGHGHSIAEVTGLSTALDGKASASALQALAASTASDVAALEAVDTDLTARVVDLEGAPGGGGGGSAAVVVSDYVTSGPFTATEDAVWTLVGIPGMSIPAVVGDRVTFDLVGLLDLPGTTTFYDLVVRKAGAIARTSSTGGAGSAVEGDPALYPSGIRFRPGAAWMTFVVTADDLDGGVVTFDVAHKGGSGTAVLATGSFPMRWTARNDGQGA